MSTFQLLLEQLDNIDHQYSIEVENGSKVIKTKYGKFYYYNLSESILLEAIITMRANQLIMNGYSLEQIIEMRRGYEKK